MKVTVCPNCRITPEITNTMLKCPKCGRMATGGALNETVTKWNAGEVTSEKVTKAVIKDEAAPKEEIKPIVTDEEVAKSFVEDVEAVKEVLKKPKKAVKPVEKTPVKRTTTKRGMR